MISPAFGVLVCKMGLLKWFEQDYGVWSVWNRGSVSTFSQVTDLGPGPLEGCCPASSASANPASDCPLCSWHVPVLQTSGQRAGLKVMHGLANESVITSLDTHSQER